jgi:hypothetical protein
VSVGQGRKLFKWRAMGEGNGYKSWENASFFQFHVFEKTNGKLYTAFGDYFIEGKFWSEISQSKMPTPHLLFLLKFFF